LPPALLADFVADVLADAPIESDECLVDGGDCPRPRGVDQFENDIEIGGCRQFRFFGFERSRVAMWTSLAQIAPSRK
jgi:hypothetical protein